MNVTWHHHLKKYFPVTLIISFRMILDYFKNHILV